MQAVVKRCVGSALAALLLAAAVPGPVQSYDTYRSWLVACDNTLSCVAKGVGDGAARAEIQIDRAAGPDAAPSLTIAAEGRWTLRDVTVDGKPAALDAGGWTVATDSDTTTIASRNPAAVRALVGRLRDATTLTLGRGDTAVSLDGLSAALLRIDARQGRVGGVTALARTGPAPASRVPPAPPVPRIPSRPIVAHLAAGEGARLIARVRRAERAVFAREDCEIDTNPAEASAYALDAGRALVLIPCLMGAYQGSDLGFVVPRAGGAATRLALPIPYQGAGPEDGTAIYLTNASFDPKTGMLSMFAKGRGLADCGTSADWIWDGRAFRLAMLTKQDSCGGVEAGDWPVLFRSIQ